MRAVVTFPSTRSTLQRLEYLRSEFARLADQQEALYQEAIALTGEPEDSEGLQWTWDFLSNNSDDMPMRLLERCREMERCA